MLDELPGGVRCAFGLLPAQMGREVGNHVVEPQVRPTPAQQVEDVLA